MKKEKISKSRTIKDKVIFWVKKTRKPRSDDYIANRYNNRNNG